MPTSIDARLVLIQRRQPERKTVTRSVSAWASVALLAYGVVMVALTLLKAFFVIGMLWRPEAQRGRSVEWVPFAQFRDAQSWFGPLFDALGNLALFVPLGVLLFILLENRARAVLVVVTCGAVTSISVEVLQYVFALGNSDVTDLVFNTVGALAGAVIARWCGRWLYPVWVGVALVAAVVFAVLVALGPGLGDPEKVVDLAGGEAQPAATAAAAAAPSARP